MLTQRARDYGNDHSAVNVADNVEDSIRYRGGNSCGDSSRCKVDVDGVSV